MKTNLDEVYRLLKEFNEELEDLNGSDEAAGNKENTMDRREIIREIMALSAKDPGEFKGGEEEKIETISALAEKLAYAKGKEEKPDADEITTVNPGEIKTETETITETESPENEEEQDAAKCDAAQQPMQAARVEIRAVPAEAKDEATVNKAVDRMNEMADLKERLTPYIGNFNAAKLKIRTAADMADYALKKLGKKAKGDKLAFLEGLLANMQSAEKMYGMAADSADSGKDDDDTIAELLKGVK